MEITIDGLICYVKVYGKGQPLILLHGWGQTHAFWKNLIPILRKKFTVYVLDLPGFGYSQEPSSTWLIEHYANFLHAFVMQHDIDTPILIGHSFGGRIAAQYASMFPTRKLVLYSTSGILPLPFKMKLFKMVVSLFRFMFPNQLYRFQSWIFKPQQYKNSMIITTHRSQRMLSIFLSHFENLESIYSKLTVPTLLIYGKYDFIIKLGTGKKIHSLLRKSILSIVPNSTHFSHIENPLFFNTVLIKFLQSP